MSAGRRNRLITIQRPVVSISNTGSTTQAWETFVSLWAEMKDRTSTGVENEHASTTLSTRRADWVIRQTTGITPAMRIVYDNTVWDILAINSLSYDRNKMLIVTEQRASLTAEDVVTCPTLCERIAAADAQDIVDCLSPAQEAAVEALICPASQDATFTLNSEQVGTAAGGETLNVQVLQGGVEVGSLVGGDWVVPEPDPATYTNGAAFTQEINAGETYTAPQVTMTAVDGTTENIPANTNYVCEWVNFQLQSTDGTRIATIDSFPTGAVYELLDVNIFDATNVLFASLPYRQEIKIINANLASAVNDTPQDGFHNLTIEVNVPVVNSAGDSVGSNVESLLIPAEVDDVNLTDSDGAVGSYPMPTTLTVVGQVNSATYSGGTLTITPAGGGGALSLIPKRPHLTQVTSYGYGTEGWAIAQGYLTYLDEGRQQDLDLTAANPFTTLKHSVSGSTARFRDSSGNDLIYGGLTVADGIVGDYLTDLMHYVIPFTNGAGYADILTKVEALNTANHAGYNDWFLTPRCVIEALFDFNSTNSPSTSLGRPPGFSSSWLNAIATGTTYETNTGFIYLGWQNGTDRLITFRGKTASNLNNYMICRRMNAY